MRTSTWVVLGACWPALALAATEQESGAASPDRTITFEASEMMYDPEALAIQAGETVRFEIHNSGALEHEFVIGDAAAQEEHRRMMQEMEGHDHEHGDHGGHDMAEGEHGGSMPAVTVAPGETATLEWTAPRGVSRLEYACNIPGHYEAGMSGEITLQE
ncbi:cupredoxin domain-containing protein [Billgrantia lactosivorans]|uniref:cupredoxin domain-containing protein n=1 Tax=Billgrantia lactosivorans TaxID=2185141 RepID=UPI001FE26410|nr:plastocyanin/azurin family copper-binding protein [Halomonas lactosivorans]